MPPMTSTSLPYRKSHSFSANSPESGKRNKNSLDTLGKTTAAMHSPREGTSYYPSPSNKEFREKNVGPLDIRNINHEAIKSDLELKILSRNPSAFFDYLDDDEDESDDDDDKYLYAYTERLVNNPEEEYRLRDFLQRQDASDDKDVHVNEERLVNNPLRHSLKRQNATILTNDNTHDNNSSNWEDHIKFGLLKTLRAIAFVIFMIYWIIKEPIIRTVTVFTMMISTLIVDPAIFIFSTVSDNQNLIPSLERRKKITSWCTLAAFISLFICLSPYMSPYFPGSISNTLNTLKSYISYEVQPRYVQFSNPDLAHLIKASNKDNSKIWSTLEKLQSVESTNHKLWERIQEDQSQLVLDNKNIWTEIHQHKSENIKILSKLQDHQNQIDSIKQSIDNNIRNAIESRLPEMILVHTKDGKLELSPQFYTYLQDSSFWNKFLNQNEDSIKKYFAGQMNQFFEKQQKQGAVISKESFIKLLSDTLLQNQYGSTENTDVSLDGLVQHAMKKYHQDVLNTADFALQSRGARILHRKSSSTYSPISRWIQRVRRSAGLPVPYNTPEMAISPQTHVGECWQMYGNQGTLSIVLSEPIMIQGITVEYPSTEVMKGKMETAPREIVLFGISDYLQASANLVLLGSMEYDIKKESIQTFDLGMNPTNVFGAVLIKFESNWGSVDHTDIYRIRIHGVPL